MASYTIEQHIQMIKLYYQIECSLLKTLRTLRSFYSRRGGPSKSTFQRLVTKFQTTGSVNNQPSPECQRNARSNENIAAVRESLQETPRQSIPRRAQALGFSQTSTWRILRRDLDLHPYKIQLTQQLKVNDHSNAVCSLTALRRIWKRTPILAENSSLVTQCIFG